MAAGSAFYCGVAQCVSVCFKDTFFVNVFLIWVLKKVIKACCKNDSDWRGLSCTSPSRGSWQLGRRVGAEGSTNTLAE